MRSLGGCFRQGPGLIGITGQGTLTFTARNMRANDSYVFRVIVVKGDRTDTAETRLSIVDGSPLTVDIGFVYWLTLLLVRFSNIETIVSFLLENYSSQITVLIQLAATLRWSTAGGAIRISLYDNFRKPGNYVIMTS